MEEKHSLAKYNRGMAIYLIILLAFLTHVGFAGSRLAVPLFAVDQGGTPLVVGTAVALYAVFPAILALPCRPADTARR